MADEPFTDVDTKLAILGITPVPSSTQGWWWISGPVHSIERWAARENGTLSNFAGWPSKEEMLDDVLAYYKEHPTSP